MAPELVRGETARPTGRRLVLGATLYAGVEGRPPYGGDAAELLAAVLNDPPPPARRGRPLAPLLDRLLARIPAERPSHGAIRRRWRTPPSRPRDGPPELMTSG
jgi:serine/threonine protein kinase